jgi:hypothetical protein
MAGIQSSELPTVGPYSCRISTHENAIARHCGTALIIRLRSRVGVAVQGLRARLR